VDDGACRCPVGACGPAVDLPASVTGTALEGLPMSTSANLPTTLSEKALGRVWAVGTVLLTTVASQALVSVAWRVVTGTKPPRRGDPEVSAARSGAWGVTSVVGLAVTGLLVRRSGLGTPGR
jgi:hypothetical protein